MIAKAVYYNLSNAGGLTALVGTNIFPEIAPEGTTVPLVVYSILDISPEYDKSGLRQDASTVGIMIFDDDFTDAVDILTQVRTALETVTGTFNGVTVTRAEITAIQSGFDLETMAFWWKVTMSFDNN